MAVAVGCLPTQKRLRRARFQHESAVEQLENAVEKEKIVLTPDVQGRHAREGEETRSRREKEAPKFVLFLELVLKQNDTSRTPRIVGAAVLWGEQSTRTPGL